jgi:hypothetical protein
MDQGHVLLVGAFISPAARRAQHAVEPAAVADKRGLDLVTLYDHLYQPGFVDTRTSRIRLSHNVLNLRLRPPVMPARAAASVDLLPRRSLRARDRGSDHAPRGSRLAATRDRVRSTHRAKGEEDG